MWFKEPDITEILFNIQKNTRECYFTQVMWFEESGMAEVLFNT